MSRCDSAAVVLISKRQGNLKMLHYTIPYLQIAKILTSFEKKGNGSALLMNHSSNYHVQSQTQSVERRTSELTNE